VEPWLRRITADHHHWGDRAGCRSASLVAGPVHTTLESDVNVPIHRGDDVTPSFGPGVIVGVSAIVTCVVVAGPRTTAVVVILFFGLLFAWGRLRPAYYQLKAERSYPGDDLVLAANALIEGEDAGSLLFLSHGLRWLPTHAPEEVIAEAEVLDVQIRSQRLLGTTRLVLRTSSGTRQFFVGAPIRSVERALMAEPTGRA